MRSDENEERDPEIVSTTVERFERDPERVEIFAERIESVPVTEAISDA